MTNGIIRENVRLKSFTIKKKVQFTSPLKEGQGFFLYIGNKNKRVSDCMKAYKSRYSFDNYNDAKINLTQLKNTGLKPDFIIIDLPLNCGELSDFMFWIHKQKWSYLIPVLYNKSGLKRDELKQLKKLDIVDDIVNMGDFCARLNSRILLISKSKSKKKQTKADAKKNFQRKVRTPLGKRIFDVVIASVLLILTSPLFLIISLIIKIESRGPIIYKSKRAGCGYKIFDFYKFRTMIKDADKEIKQFSNKNQYSNDNKKGVGQFFKLENDPRVTRFGRFLRKLSLDELPQLFNVLKGDMSIVGNRPLPLYEANTLTTNWSVERFSAPAGITGLWQVTKRGREEMNSNERIGLDIAYARKQSFLLDCRILMMTPLALIQKSDV